MLELAEFEVRDDSVMRQDFCVSGCLSAAFFMHKRGENERCAQAQRFCKIVQIHRACRQHQASNSTLLAWIDHFCEHMLQQVLDPREESTN